MQNTKSLDEETIIKALSRLSRDQLFQLYNMIRGMINYNKQNRKC